MPITFQANANEDKIVLDTTYLPDPFTYKFTLNIQNQSQQTLYFKILSGNSNWSITLPSGGELGSIGSASSKTFVIQMQRSKPASDVVETIPLTIEAYTDSGYTNRIDQGTLNLTALVADIRNFENVTIYDFEDGTSQGWTLTNFSIANDASVEAGGYSSKLHYAAPYSNWFTETGTMTLSGTSLPQNTRVVLSILFSARLRAYNEYYPSRIDTIKIKINDEVVSYIDTLNLGYRNEEGGTIVFDWAYIGVDLSAYAGQQVDLQIEVNVASKAAASSLDIWIDDIIIAGTDSL